MASIDRYRPPPREAYQPPPPPPPPPPAAAAATAAAAAAAVVASANAPRASDRHPSRSPSAAFSRRRDVPPAVPSPPTQTSRTSPPRPQSQRSAPSPARRPSLLSAPPPPPPPPPSSSRPSMNQWLFTLDEVLSAPSIADGLPPVEERLRRAKGINFVFQAGVLLKLPHTTLWVASVFLHRFYMRYSMLEERGGVHHYNIAATALFLANKTEENCRKTKDIIVAVAKVAQKNKDLIIDEQSKEYWRWRDSILMYEELMLELLTFDLNVDNPYDHLYAQLSKHGAIRNRALREYAWAVCSDACMTTLPLVAEPADIAMAATFFASAALGERIADGAHDEPWWSQVGGDEDRIARAVDVMADFYAENPLKNKDGRYQASPPFNLDSTRRRGELAAAYAQPEPGSSQNDGGGGGGGGDDNNDQDKMTTESDSQATRVDPSASLTNGSGGVKRKSAEPDQDSEAEREQKRTRYSDEDEGEVRE